MLAARWRIMASSFPLRMSAVFVPFQDTIGVRPWLMAHVSLQVGKGNAKE